MRALRRAGRVILHVRSTRAGPAGAAAAAVVHRVELAGGRLVAVEPWLPLVGGRDPAPTAAEEHPPRREEFDELVAVTRWLRREAVAGRVRLVRVERPIAVDLPWPEAFDIIPATRPVRSGASGPKR